jgi:3,4-dihydroxy-2-butanone 4-phosphate synthase
VVTDDDDREGEGDLIVAASLCTAEKMAFIIRHTSGIVCAPVTSEDARRLRLDPMVAHNDSNHSTAFTVSIDYKPGMTTGISAEERAATCRALVNSNVGANDFARPGQNPMTYSTPARLYQLRSKMMTSPAAGNCWIYRCMNICVFRGRKVRAGRRPETRAD